MKIIYKDTNLTQSGNTATVLLLLCGCWLQDNRFCHLTLCVVATQCLQNRPLPHRYHRYSHWKGLACMGGSSFRVWKQLCFCVCHICIRIGPSGDLCIILMSCFLVLAWSPPKTQPTGSFTAVSQPLSRIGLSHQLVCLRVFCSGPLLICCTHAPP